MHQVHEEVHRELELEYSHVEHEYVIDAAVQRARRLGIAVPGAHDPAADFAQRPDPFGGAAVDCALYQRDENQLRRKYQDAQQRDPRLQVDQVSEHADEDPALQQRFDTLVPTKPPIGSASDRIMEISVPSARALSSLDIASPVDADTDWRRCLTACSLTQAR